MEITLGKSTLQHRAHYMLYTRQNVIIFYIKRQFTEVITFLRVCSMIFSTSKKTVSCSWADCIFWRVPNLVNHFSNLGHESWNVVNLEKNPTNSGNCRWKLRHAKYQHEPEYHIFYTTNSTKDERTDLVWTCSWSWETSSIGRTFSCLPTPVALPSGGGLNSWWYCSSSWLASSGRQLQGHLSLRLVVHVV